MRKVSKISHEIRTPLSAIVALVDFLKSTHLSQEQQSYIQDIEISARQIFESEEKIYAWIDGCLAQRVKQ